MKRQAAKKVQQDNKQRHQASSKPIPSKWAEMNRKQRREIMRKMQSEGFDLEVVHPHAAGIDIGNESHYVAVPASLDPQPVRCYGRTTAELKKMAEWLTQCGIRTVALQSTGVYWIAVYDILEAAGLEVYLVNARETKNLPGRKTDVQESQWLMKLHTYGFCTFCLPALCAFASPACWPTAVGQTYCLSVRTYSQKTPDRMHSRSPHSLLHNRLASAVRDVPPRCCW
jgi:hypothetical protein